MTIHFRPGTKLVAAMTALLVSGAIAVGFVPPASAAAAPGTLGKLSITPASGTDTQVITVTTVNSGSGKGCPTPATNVTGTISGPGTNWAASRQLSAFPNNRAAVSNTVEFGVPLAASMLTLSQNFSAPIVPGEYVVTVTCQDSLGFTTYGTFVGSFWFTTTTAWTATDPNGPTPTPTPTPTPGKTPTPTPTPGTTPTPTPGTTPTPTPTPTPGTTPTPTPTPTATPTPTPTPSTTPTPTPSPTGSATTTVLKVYKVAFDGTSLIVREGRSLRAVVAVTPPTADGTVQVFDTVDGKTTPVRQPRTLRDGNRRFVIPGLSQGTHTLTAVFTPGAGSKYAKSTSKAITVQVVAGRTCRHHDDDDHSLAWRVRGAD